MTELDPVRQKAAMARVQSHLDAAKLAEDSAFNQRAKARTLARTWGLHVGEGEVGMEACGISDYHNVRSCCRPKGHDGKHSMAGHSW